MAHVLLPGEIHLRQGLIYVAQYLWLLLLLPAGSAQKFNLARENYTQTVLASRVFCTFCGLNNFTSLHEKAGASFASRLAVLRIHVLVLE